MSQSVAGRRVVRIAETAFLPYDLEGPVQPEMSWLPITFDRAAWQGCYLMRIQPGAATMDHDHPGPEEFIILEGEPIDSDGTVFKAGDFVSYEAGTRHHSRTESGCLIAVFEWRRPLSPA